MTPWLRACFKLTQCQQNNFPLPEESHQCNKFDPISLPITAFSQTPPFIISYPAFSPYAPLNVHICPMFSRWTHWLIHVPGYSWPATQVSRLCTAWGVGGNNSHVIPTQENGGQYTRVCSCVSKVIVTGRIRHFIAKNLYREGRALKKEQFKLRFETVHVLCVLVWPNSWSHRSALEMRVEVYR